MLQRETHCNACDFWWNCPEVLNVMKDWKIFGAVRPACHYHIDDMPKVSKCHPHAPKGRQLAAKWIHPLCWRESSADWMNDALNDISGSWKNRYRKWILNHASLHKFKSLLLRKRDTQVPVHACNQFTETSWYTRQAHRLVYTQWNLWMIESSYLSNEFISYFFSHGLKYHVTNQQVAAFPWGNTMCASQIDKLHLVVELQACLPSSVLLACHCADRQYPLVSSGHCHWWREVVTCHSDMWEQRACPLDRPAGWAGLQLFSFVNAGRSLITAVIFV